MTGVRSTSAGDDGVDEAAWPVCPFLTTQRNSISLDGAVEHEDDLRQPRSDCRAPQRYHRRATQQLMPPAARRAGSRCRLRASIADGARRLHERQAAL